MVSEDLSEAIVPLVPSGAPVRLWRIDADAAPERGDLLSPQERARAARFLRSQDKRRFVAFHAALRVVLGAALGMAPEAVPLIAPPGVKPRLAWEGPRFSLSHSDATGLIALSPGADVGVDLERVRPLPQLATLARRVLAPEELHDWSALPEACRAEAFFRYWTAKEAYVKGTGEGLALPLDRIRLRFAPGPELVSVSGRSGGGWSLYALDAGVPGHVAALAVARDGR